MIASFFYSFAPIGFHVEDLRVAGKPKMGEIRCWKATITFTLEWVDTGQVIEIGLSALQNSGAS